MTMNEKNTSNHWHEKMWARTLAALLVAYVSFFLIYGAMTQAYYQAHHLDLDIHVQLDGFGYSLRPAESFARLSLEERNRDMDLYENTAKMGFYPPWVHEGPAAFCFAVGSHLGLAASLTTLALCGALWAWWFGPRFSLMAMIAMVLGYGAWLGIAKLVVYENFDYARAASIIPLLAIGVAMLAQHAHPRKATTD